MSLRAIVEIVVHLESFRNIDLFFQGIYYTRFRLHSKKKQAEIKGANGQNTTANNQASQQTNANDPNQQASQGGDRITASGQAQGSHNPDQVEYAQPYCSYVSYYQQEKVSKASKQGPDHHNLMPAQIVDEQACFLSKAFLIRYCEEEVEVNDIVLFRAELDVEPDYLHTDFYLEVDLFFSDLSNLGGPEKWQQHVDEFETSAVFKKVSTQTFKLRGLPQGLCEFVPVTFQDQYFSLLKIQVWSVLLDFRFRLKQINFAAQTAAVAASTAVNTVGANADSASAAKNSGGRRSSRTGTA